MIPKLKKWLNSNLWFPAETKGYTVLKKMNADDKDGIDIVLRPDQYTYFWPYTHALIITINDRKI